MSADNQKKEELPRAPFKKPDPPLSAEQKAARDRWKHVNSGDVKKVKEEKE